MKKILGSLLVLLFVCLLIGCKSQKKYEIIGHDEVEVGCSIVLSVDFDGTVEWVSSNPEVATVFEGLVIGVKSGNVTIKALFDGKEISKKITVVPNKVEITIEGTNVMFVDSSFQFKAYLSKNIEEKITWKSTDKNVATVDENGVVTAKSIGIVEIVASVLESESSFKVKVYSYDFSISIIGENVAIIGEETKFGVNVSNDIAGQIEWKVSDETIAKIDQNGNFIGLKEGKVVVFVSLYNKVSSIEVDVVTDPNAIRIIGSNVIRIDQSMILESNYDVYWSTSDENIADIFDNGEVIPNGIGKVVITATDKNDSNNIATFNLEIIGKTPSVIKVTGKNKIGIGQTLKLNVETFPSTASKRAYFFSNNPFVATVDENGIVKGVHEGVAIITVVSQENENITNAFEITITQAAPSKIVVSGENELKQGMHTILSYEIPEKDVSKEVVWESERPEIAIVYQGIVLGVNEGAAKIYAKSAIDEDIYGYIEINVSKKQAEDVNSENLERVNKIIEKMSLEEKVGQLFIVGFNSTTLADSLKKDISLYHFGNVIYMGYNVSDYTLISKLSNDIQETMMELNGVPAFISTDQEGGRVARLTNGGTHFISNMAMGATGNYENTLLEGIAMGKELSNYGINVDFAPVLDVNNNPENPIIGIRSYSDNPVLVSLYGNNMFKGLAKSNVMGCVKHFPGHGNTSVDTHYGLPTINSSINNLYQTELAPFISAINNGIDSIMTTHIIFSAIDTEYPATLSEKVLTGLLRETLGYDGLIITDGMEMDAISKNFGSYDETAVLAIKAGVDILTYTTTANPKKAYSGIIDAIANGELTEERINESVRRILLKKLKYGILDNYTAPNDDISELLSKNDELNSKFAIESLTMIKGELSNLDKSKSTLIISPTTNYNLGEDLEYNSFANFACNYLKNNGYENCDFQTVSNNLNNSDSNNLLSKAQNYDQIVVAFSNIKTGKVTVTANFVKQLTELEGKDVIVIALDTPYDLMVYGNNVKNYICVFGYQKATCLALAKMLNGEFIPQGKSPIDINIFNLEQ